MDQTLLHQNILDLHLAFFKLAFVIFGDFKLASRDCFIAAFIKNLAHR